MSLYIKELLSRLTITWKIAALVRDSYWVHTLRITVAVMEKQQRTYTNYLHTLDMCFSYDLLPAGGMTPDILEPLSPFPGAS